jgi:MOSC domain-containing protein YiiM
MIAKTLLFIGDIRPLPESGRPTGMYKQAATGKLDIGFDGFTADQQADKRVHGGPEKAIHLYPAAHYAKLAERFPDAAAKLIPGSNGENISTPDLTEADVHIGDIYRLGSARLQVCQPRNPCWKIDERYSSEGMAAFIAEHRLTGWYWRVLTPGHCFPGDDLQLETPATTSQTLAEAMLLWQNHRPPLAELEQLAATPGIATQWQCKMEQRMQWLHKNPLRSSEEAPE